MALAVNGSTHLIPAYYSFYRPRKDERLSWPSWLTYSGWLTHISGHPSAAGRVRTGKVRPPETDVLPLCHATNLTWVVPEKGPLKGCVTAHSSMTSLVHENGHLEPYSLVGPEPMEGDECKENK